MTILDICAYIFFTVIVILITYFVCFRGEAKPPVRAEPEGRRRRHHLADRLRNRELAEEESDDSGGVLEGGEEAKQSEEEKLSKRELNKLLKKREKEEHRREDKQRYQSEKQQKREEERLARELETKKKEEEAKKKEEDEYLKWKIGFAVDQVGVEAEEDLVESQSKLASFILYITSRKVVSLDDLAAEFSMPTADVIDRILALEKAERLSGIMDDRGKYIYISPEEFKVARSFILQTVAAFLKRVGRITKADLVRECNKLISLKEEIADQQRQQQEVAALAKELEQQAGIPESVPA